jgi:hypothetical protein
LCEVVFSLFESGQPGHIEGSSSLGQAASCVPEALGW